MRFTVLLFLTIFGHSLLIADERPNIVFFLADDLGIGDVRCYGKELCRIETPNFDSLATEGIQFTDMHSIASVCVPSRMAMMTGRYPWRFGAPEPGGPWGFLGARFNPNTFTLGDMLEQSGYHTGYIGKWHLGTRMTTTDGKTQGLTNVDYTRPLKLGPVQYGFAESFILPGSLDMYPYAFIRNNMWQGKVTAQKGWSAFNRLGPAEENFEDYEVLQTLTKESETFIEKNAGKARSGKPFFLYVALTAPHTPTSPHPKFQGKSDLGLYGDFVMEVDDCLGRIMKALETHGLSENTLILATSDHGPASYAGNEKKSRKSQFKAMQALGHYSNAMYRGFKFSIYEGANRVPFIARWPKGIRNPGRECDHLLGLQDLFQTLAEVSGFKSSPVQAPDSQSFASIFNDGSNPSSRNNLVIQSTRSWAIRDDNWKLCLCPGSGCPGNYGNEPADLVAWKAAIADFGRNPTVEDFGKAPFVQLFDLKTDPGESLNLAMEHPKRVEKMLNLLKEKIHESPNDRNINLYSGVPKFVLQ